MRIMFFFFPSITNHSDYCLYIKMLFPVKPRSSLRIPLNIQLQSDAQFIKINTLSENSYCICIPECMEFLSALQSN